MNCGQGGGNGGPRRSQDLGGSSDSGEWNSSTCSLFIICLLWGACAVLAAQADLEGSVPDVLGVAPMSAVLCAVCTAMLSAGRLTTLGRHAPDAPAPTSLPPPLPATLVVASSCQLRPQTASSWSVSEPPPHTPTGAPGAGPVASFGKVFTLGLLAQKACAEFASGRSGSFTQSAPTMDSSATPEPPGLDRSNKVDKHGSTWKVSCSSHFQTVRRCRTWQRAACRETPRAHADVHTKGESLLLAPWCPAFSISRHGVHACVHLLPQSTCSPCQSARRR